MFLPGDFYYTEADQTAGTIPAGKTVGDLRTDGASYVFEGAGLSSYERDANGNFTGRQYVYRVREATGSDAYESTYIVGSSTYGEWTDYAVGTGSNIAVQNKLVATNEANIAAVKQLIGRDWQAADVEDGSAIDRYVFKLHALGKGKYYTAEEAQAYNTQHASDEGFVAVQAGDPKVSKLNGGTFVDWTYTSSRWFPDAR